MILAKNAVPRYCSQQPFAGKIVSYKDVIDRQFASFEGGKMEIMRCIDGQRKSRSSVRVLRSDPPPMLSYLIDWMVPPHERETYPHCQHSIKSYFWRICLLEIATFPAQAEGLRVRITEYWPQFVAFLIIEDLIV